MCVEQGQYYVVEVKIRFEAIGVAGNERDPACGSVGNHWFQEAYQKEIMDI